jgi:Ohr subfamily peroxiredoxin
MDNPKVLYTAEALATGDGRSGRAATPAGEIDVQLDVPQGMGGAGGTGTNPEQLFAAGFAACFHSAVRVVGRRMKVDTSDSSVTAKVGIGRIEGGRYGLTVDLQVSMPAVERETAEKLVELAHEVCPYSNATRGNIPVGLSLV